MIEYIAVFTSAAAGTLVGFSIEYFRARHRDYRTRRVGMYRALFCFENQKNYLDQIWKNHLEEFEDHEDRHCKLNAGIRVKANVTFDYDSLMFLLDPGVKGSELLKRLVSARDNYLTTKRLYEERNSHHFKCQIDQPIIGSATDEQQKSMTDVVYSSVSSSRQETSDAISLINDFIEINYRNHTSFKLSRD